MTIEIVIASGNKGKLKEINQVISPLGYIGVAQKTLEVPEPEETGLTFVENALIKARNAARITGRPALADDSGIEVDVLHGQPGIYSARYAGPDATDKDNVNKLLDAVSTFPEAQRNARFQCVIVYLRHADDPTPLICQGTWEGYIAQTPGGENGFGYDPVFFVPSEQCVAAQLSPEIKNKLSHRGQALASLMKQLQQQAQ
ncbi:non-canonical purine NTP pyrophosphatase, RdgB/HAM1 family [Gammaproteobacteria bacterium 45_16_T64]|nr:non-canonical purine NTP pyrophosphatase, RdgB/HAM1 family [Gammaproteobacteria bacterium 45_16_T64]